MKLDPDGNAARLRYFENFEIKTRFLQQSEYIFTFIKIIVLKL